MMRSKETNTPLLFWERVIMRHDKRSDYWTKKEALALVGKVVSTNAQEQVKIVDTFCTGPNQYSVVGADKHLYRKCDHNGLYCWLPENLTVTEGV